MYSNQPDLVSHHWQEESSLASVRAELHESIFKWHRNLKTRTEVQPCHLELRGHPDRDENVLGIKIGHW